MTIPLTTTGGLLTRLGHLYGYMLDIIAMRGGNATTHVASGASVPSRLAQIMGDYAASVADYLTPGPYLPSSATSFQATLGSLEQTFQSMASDTVIAMANLDTPQTGRTLQSSLQLLINQMIGASASIKSAVPAVGAQTALTGVTPVGTPLFVFGTKDGAGRVLQYVFPENLTVTMTGDAQTGSTAGQEPWSMVGQNAQTDFLAFDWLTSKYGSGCSLSGNLVDGSVNSVGGSGTGNLLTNSDFRVFTTTNYPDNWVILTGVVVTNIINGTGTSFLTGGGSLKFLGDGATLTSVAQTFSTTPTTALGAGGTPSVLVAGAINNAVYIFNLNYKATSVSSFTGVLQVDLIDGSNTVINDDQGNANTVTLDVSTIGDTNWHQLSGSFHLPQVLPSTVKLRIWQSTTFASGKHLFIADVAMTIASQLYQSGPYVAGFSGATKVNASGVAPDAWTFAVTNTVGGVDIRTTTIGTTQNFQKLFWQIFNIPQFGLIIPNSGSPSITDATYIV